MTMRGPGGDQARADFRELIAAKGHAVENARAAVARLDVALRLFPFGDPIRDAGHVRLLARLRAVLHPSLGMSTEVPIPIAGDLRAWDAVIVGGGWRQPAEAETVLDDIQALERRLALKQRDAGVERLLVVIADTNRNRRVLRAAPDAFAAYPLRGSAVIGALREGRQPAASGLVLL